MENSIKISVTAEKGTSDKIFNSEENLQLIELKEARNDIAKCAMPKENLQVKKPIKTYKRVKKVKFNTTSKGCSVLKLSSKPYENLAAKTDEKLDMEPTKAEENTCKICNKNFDSCKILKTGISNICQMCIESYQLKYNQVENTMIHNVNENMCNYCHDFFENSAILIDHVRLKHHCRNYEKAFLCDICDDQFPTFALTASHRKTHIILSNEDKEDINEDNSRECYFCSFCLQSFSTKISLQIHSVKSRCKDLNQILLDGKLRRYSASPKPNLVGKVFSCTMCSKKFKARFLLEDHLDWHIGLKKYKCKHCEVGFSSKASLKYHDLSIHQRKRYQCEYCSKEYTSKCRLKEHINHHLNIKPHKCESCPKSFLRSIALKRHRLTHTGEKPYACDVCHKEFSSKYNFRVHYRIHTGEKPFVCEICNKAFRVKLILNEHYKTHRSKNVK